MMAKRKAIEYLRLLFEEDAQFPIKKGERQIDSILRIKLERFQNVFCKDEDVNEWLNRTIHSSCIWILSCETCYSGKQEGCRNCIQQIISYFSPDLKKKFTLCCMHILFVLDEEVKKEIDSDVRLPPGTLFGANDRKLISTALQFIISFGFYLNFHPGIGYPITQRSCFGNLLEKEKAVHCTDTRFLFVCVKSICQLIRNKDLGELIISKYLGDIFGGLMQLAFADKATTNTSESGKKQDAQNHHDMEDSFLDLNVFDLCSHEKGWCKKELSKLFDSVYQPLVIRELLKLQGFWNSKEKNQSTPKWLQRKSSFFLTKKLMQNDGLKNLLKAIFEEYDLNGTELVVRCDMIGYLVSTCPFQSVSLPHYYSLMSKQILEMIDIRNIDEATKHLYGQIASRCTHWMLKKDLELTSALVITPLMKTFHTIAKFEFSDKDIFISEEEICRSIENIYKVFCKKDSPELVAALSKFAKPLFEVYILLRSGISYLKHLVFELLLCILEHSSEHRGLEILHQFLFATDTKRDESSNEERKLTHIEVANGDNGGLSFKRTTVTSVASALLMKDYLSTEDRIDGILSLLSPLTDAALVGKFFLMLLEKISRISEEGSCYLGTSISQLDHHVSNLKHSIPTVAMVAAMCDKFGDKLFSDKKELIPFLKITMECCLTYDSETKSHDLKLEMLNLSLTILSLLLDFKEDDVNYEEFNGFIEVLESIEKTVKNEAAVKFANDLRTLILTHGVINRQNSDFGEEEYDAASDEAYDAAIRDLTDKIIPTRGHAIIQLSQLLEKGNEKAEHNVQILIDIFMDNLLHDDSYIYLASIRALTSVSQKHHQVVIPRLAKEFATFTNEVNNSGIGFPGNCTGPKKPSPEKRLKIGEALMKSIKSCGSILPRYSQVVMASLLTGVKDDDDDVRASSLSNIGEACKLLRFSLGPVVNELMHCISSILRFDRKPMVQRAALLVIIMMLDGLGKDTFQAIGDILKDVYRNLKFVLRTSDDEATKEFAETALNKIESITKGFLFPHQSFTKRIHVLQAKDPIN